MSKIKICGLCDLEDYNAAVRLGADYTGFIFYPGSTRFIDKEAAFEIICGGVRKNNRLVGVFVNEEVERVREIYEYLRLDIVQLHGDESPGYCRGLELPYWKAIRVKDESSLEQLSRYDAGTFLLDTFVEGSYGGTGKSFDPGLASRAIAAAGEKQVVIAGGVSEDNIAGILSLNPFAVDVCSSVEEKPGKKSREKMARFFRTVRGCIDQCRCSP